MDVVAAEGAVNQVRKALGLDVTGSRKISKVGQEALTFLLTTDSLSDFMTQKFSGLPENRISSEEAIKQAKKIPLFARLINAGKVEEVKEIFTPDKAQAWGSYRNTMIEFIENPQETTLPHETFHAFVDLFAEEKSKQAAFNAVKLRKGNKDLSDAQVEEILSEEFANWFIAGNKPKGAVEKFFAHVKKLMKTFTQDGKITKLFEQAMQPHEGEVSSFQDDNVYQTKNTEAKYTLERLKTVWFDEQHPNKIKAAIAFINPADFLQATTPIAHIAETLYETETLDVKRLQETGDVPRIQVIWYDQNSEGVTAQNMWENIFEDESNIPSSRVKIIGHEGRHRMQALANLGITKAPVLIHYNQLEVDPIGREISKEDYMSNQMPSDGVIARQRDWQGQDADSFIDLSYSNLINIEQGNIEELELTFSMGSAQVKFQEKQTKETDDFMDDLVLATMEDGELALINKNLAKNVDADGNYKGQVVAGNEITVGAKWNSWTGAPSKTDYMVGTSGILDKFKGKKLGKRLYLKMMDELIKKGGESLSSDNLSMSAIRVWKGLIKTSNQDLIDLGFPQLVGVLDVDAPAFELVVHEAKQSGDLTSMEAMKFDHYSKDYDPYETNELGNDLEIYTKHIEPDGTYSLEGMTVDEDAPIFSAHFNTRKYKENIAELNKRREGGEDVKQYRRGGLVTKNSYRRGGAVSRNGYRKNMSRLGFAPGGLVTTDYVGAPQLLIGLKNLVATVQNDDNYNPYTKLLKNDLTNAALQTANFIIENPSREVVIESVRKFVEDKRFNAVKFKIRKEIFKDIGNLLINTYPNHETPQFIIDEVHKTNKGWGVKETKTPSGENLMDALMSKGTDTESPQFLAGTPEASAKDVL